MGENTNEKRNETLFDHFYDGTVEKKIVVE